MISLKGKFIDISNAFLFMFMQKDIYVYVMWPEYLMSHREGSKEKLLYCHCCWFRGYLDYHPSSKLILQGKRSP